MSVCVCVIAALTAMATLVAPSPAHAALELSDPAFVPDWDGENDSTTISFRLHKESVVTAWVRTRKGRVVRMLLDGEQLPAGRHTVYWDGRNAKGMTVATGRYSIAVVARALRTGGDAGGSASAPVVETAPIEIQAARVSLQDASLTRGTLGARNGFDVTQGAVTMTNSGRVSIVIVRSDGTVVRNISHTKVRSGRVSFSWNGRNDRGKNVNDGTYELVMAGVAYGKPSSTVRLPIGIDRTAPRLIADRTVSGRMTKGNVRLRVPLRLSEAATVSIRAVGARRAGWRGAFRPGKSSLTLTAGRMGYSTLRTGTRVVTLVATDSAGNRTTRRVRVTITAPPSGPSIVPVPPDSAPAPGSVKLSWPVSGVVTSEFGPRGGRLHAGLDIAAPTGTVVTAAAEGVVTFSGTMSGYGNVVIIEHPYGLTTYYAHNSRNIARVGMLVARGQLIAHVGSTGRSTGPHVHFETRAGGIPVDPRRYLS